MPYKVISLLQIHKTHVEPRDPSQHDLVNVTKICVGIMYSVYCNLAFHNILKLMYVTFNVFYIFVKIIIML